MRWLMVDVENDMRRCDEALMEGMGEGRTMRRVSSKMVGREFEKPDLSVDWSGRKRSASWRGRAGFI